MLGMGTIPARQSEESPNLAQAAVVQLPMAPKEAPCQQTHRLRLFSGDRLVFEYTQHISGIPMGDLFKVEVRWDITPVAGQEAARCQVGILWPVPLRSEPAAVSR